LIAMGSLAAVAVTMTVAASAAEVPERSVLPEGPLSGPPVASQWQLGDTWSLAVEMGPSRPKPWRYAMRVVVAGEEELRGHKCWRLEFVVDESTEPGRLGIRYVVWVSQRDGQAVDVKEIPGTKHQPTVDQFGHLRLHIWSVDVPGMILPVSTEPIQVADRDGRITLSIARDQVIEFRREYRPVQGRPPAWQVRQTWPAGAKWWTQYELLRDGNVQLRARLVTPGEAKPAPIPDEDDATARAHEAAIRAQLDKILRDASVCPRAEGTAIRAQIDAALRAADEAVIQSRLQAARRAARAAAGKPGAKPAERPAPTPPDTGENEEPAPPVEIRSNRGYAPELPSQ